LDDMLVQMHLSNWPRPAHVNKGYPYWNTHAAKKLLEVDVLSNLHKKEKPQELRKPRRKHREFPKTCFCQMGESRGGKAESSMIWGRQMEYKWYEKVLGGYCK
jgi:hypothetical protein